MAQSVVEAPPAGTGAVDVACVVVTVPAHKDYVVIIRSVVGQLGARFGYPLREIADLRLAVTEACGLLVAVRSEPGGPGTTGAGTGTVAGIECRIEVRGDLLRVTVTAPAGGFGTPDTDSFGWTIMTALVDALAWAQDGVTARVTLVKRRGTPSGRTLG